MQLDKYLVDFVRLPKKQFWDLEKELSSYCETRFKALWDKAQNEPLELVEAVECLNCLFIYSHTRIRKYSRRLAAHYPTKQYTNNRLRDKETMWWVDHFTAGISRWGTLSWFSSMKHKKKNGRRGYAGASTHFVMGYHDYPFYIIPLMHGAWHEPRRNKDSIGVEHVNCGKVHLKDGAWHFWAGMLPQDLVIELPPVLLDKPYRGCKSMQPYTKDQLVNNITLKRIVITALGSRMDYARMSQHTDWRSHKTDMGVLWPFKECNTSAYDALPIEELDFIQEYDSILDNKGTLWEETINLEKHNDENNPSYGDETPTRDLDIDEDTDVVLKVKEVQQILSKVGISVVADGVMGRKTRRALKSFQKKWNTENSKDLLKVDGIPGPRTCAALLAQKVEK